MMLSMTGYGCANNTIPLDNLPNTNTHDFAEINVELRSVNGRFLDFNFRLPDECRSLEPTLRKLLAQHIARGKIECRVQLKYPDSAQSNTILDTATLEHISRLTHQITDYFPQISPLRANDILRWPGILREPQLSQSALTTAVLNCAENALEQLNQSRAHEGNTLAHLLLQKTEMMCSLITHIQPLLPKLLEQQQQKLTEKINQALQSSLLVASDQESIVERARQELTDYTLKIDIDEELSRLNLHLQATQAILKNGPTPIGKRLDILMQELNREANTLASKAGSIEITNIAIEIKLLIEQMREQIQNLE